MPPWPHTIARPAISDDLFIGRRISRNLPANLLLSFAPTPRLQPFVRQYTIATFIPQSLAPLTIRRIPDGSSHLFINFFGSANSTCWQRASVSVSGPFTTTAPIAPSVSDLRATVDIELRAGGALALLGVPAQNIAENIRPASDVWMPAQVQELLETVACTRDARALATVIDGFLTRHLRNTPSSELIHAAMALIERERGSVSTPFLAAAIGCGERQLRRRFDSCLGMSPRDYACCVRLLGGFNAALVAARQDWTAIALDGGYCDQSHFINDFSSVLGMPPSRFFRRVDGAIMVYRRSVIGLPAAVFEQDPSRQA